MQAFFYPTRIISAFLVSVLANVTLCVLTAEYMKQARLAVYSLDSTAIRTVFKGISSLDALFYRTNVLELFDSEIDWAFQQVKLHYRCSASTLCIRCHVYVPALLCHVEISYRSCGVVP